MSGSLIMLSSACVVLFITLCVSVYFNFRHGVLILKFQDALEECLDVLDTRYRSTTKILETPVFFDSVEIRQVLSDVRRSHDAILYVANALADVAEDKDRGKPSG